MAIEGPSFPHFVCKMVCQWHGRLAYGLLTSGLLTSSPVTVQSINHIYLSPYIKQNTISRQYANTAMGCHLERHDTLCCSRL